MPAKKRRGNGVARNPEDPQSSTPMTPDRDTWQGWCEVESDPDIFNTILHDWGVRGAKVIEVVSVDPTALVYLPNPIYAMIFLYQYKGETDDGTQETPCPSNIWFANQVPEFACASVALLNIAMNLPYQVELGCELQRFKGFTRSMHPVSKGDAISSCEPIRRVHNSFARDTDMLNVDMLLKDKHAKLQKKQKVDAANAARAAKAAEKAALKAAQDSAKLTDGSFPRTNPTRKARTKKETTQQDILEDDGFHFIAYMPIDDEVWKLDGMSASPRKVGSVPDGFDWLSVIQPELERRMCPSQGDDTEETDQDGLFSLLAVVKDPVSEHRERLAQDIRLLQKINLQLDVTAPGWRASLDPNAEASTICGASEEHGIRERDILGADVPYGSLDELPDASTERLLELRQETVTRQQIRLADLMIECDDERENVEKAMQRRHDYGAFVQGWLEALAETDALQDLVDKAEI